MQLMSLLYSTDHNDFLVLSISTDPGGFIGYQGVLRIGLPPLTPAWVAGGLDFSPIYEANTALVLVVDTRFAAFAEYNKNPALYRCPDDPVLLTLPDGQRLPRIRSYSLNWLLGYPVRNGEKTDYINEYHSSIRRRLCDVMTPAPA